MAASVTSISRNLAANVLALRRNRNLTQGALAKLAEIPRSMVTLLESGAANPSVASLAAVATALQVSLEELLAKPRASSRHYRADELPLHRRSKDGVKLRKLLPDPIRSMELDELTLAPRAVFVGAPHIRGTKEYFYCFDGTFEVEVAGEPHTVRAGELLAFPGDQPHRYRNAGTRVAAGFSAVVWAV